jgi:antitoxin component HigA of HigAB toxin-antitoxin module
MPTTRQTNRLPTTFAALARLMVPHAIAGEADYDKTVALMNRLAVLGRPTAGQRQYLDTLALLIEAYDQRHNAIDVGEISPLRLLKGLLSDHGLSASDLGRMLGNRELGGKILRGERELSKAHVAILADRFKVSTDLFIRREPARPRRRKAS